MVQDTVMTLHGGDLVSRWHAMACPSAGFPGCRVHPSSPLHPLVQLVQ